MTTQNNEWREEFDKQFNPVEALKATQDGGTINIRHVDVSENIKDFIQNLLDQHSARLVERIESLKRIADEAPDGLADIWQKAHNQALDQAIDIVKNI